MSDLDWIVRRQGAAALLDGVLRYEGLRRSGSRFELCLSPCRETTPRSLFGPERRGIQMLILGRSQKEIAFDLGVSIATVSALIRLGLRRLGVPCWQHIVLAAAFLDRAAVPPDSALTEACRISVQDGRCLLDVELSFALLALTAAEREVVLAAADGSSNEQIACMSRKSERTVANQLASAFRKMGARGRLEMLRCITQQMCGSVRVPVTKFSAPTRRCCT